MLGFVQFFDKVVDTPVVVQFFDKVADVLVVQVLGGAAGAVPSVFGRPCDHAATLGLATVKVPQIQLIAGSQWALQFATDTGTLFCVGMAAVKGFSALFRPFFRAPSGRLGV